MAGDVAQCAWMMAQDHEERMIVLEEARSAYEAQINADIASLSAAAQQISEALNTLTAQYAAHRHYYTDVDNTGIERNKTTNTPT